MSTSTLAAVPLSSSSSSSSSSPLSPLRITSRTASYSLLPAHGTDNQLCGTTQAEHCADYVVIGWDPVGQGGFSDVYQGEYTRNVDGACTTSLVAVKILRVTETCHLERAIKQLDREAFVWSQIDNPFIAKFHRVALVRNRPALILDWYGQGVATRYLKDRPFETRLMIIGDIATGLTYLHSKDIVHGDIKGNNILISNEGRALITDFGLSRVMGGGSGHTTSTVSGSYPWMAPELLMSNNGQITTSKASDVWALGCTIFELLSNETPYSHLKNPCAVIFTIHEGKNPMDACTVGNIPPFLCELLERCWRLNPSARPTAAEIVELLSLH